MNYRRQQEYFINQKYQNFHKESQQLISLRNMNNLRENNQFVERTGHWTEKQNAKYFAFLSKFKHKFDQKESRRQWKVFKALSQFIKTRNANQCRSHHHKMQKNFKTIEETLEFLVKKRPNLDKRSQKYIQQLEMLQSKIFAEGNLKGFQIANNGQEQIQKKCSTQILKEEKIYVDDQLNEKKDVANAKTGTSYDAQEIIQPQNNRQILNVLPVKNFCNFTFQKIQSYPYGNLNGDYSKQSVKYNQTSQMLPFCSIYEKPFLTPYEMKAMQCQESFIKWYTKASSLIEQKQPYLGSFQSMTPHNNQYFYPYI